MASNTTELSAVTMLLAQDSTLKRIYTLLGDSHSFNFFEAMGATRQELRHSDFLGFLLDPKQNHGLGDMFLRYFLQEISSDHISVVSDIQFLLGEDLSLIKVRREWKNIDVLLVHAASRSLIITENKIDSSEHSNQLARYHDIVQSHFPGWKIVALYLTPDGERSTDHRYLPIGYGPICSALERIIAHSNIGDMVDIHVVLSHYLKMLRRHVVTDSDSELARLSRKAYREHEVAIKTITRYRVQRQEMISKYFESLVRSEETLILDQGHATGHTYFIRFAPSEWYHHQKLLVAKGWTKNPGMVMLFQFIHTPNMMGIDLAVGPGPMATAIRQQLYEVARKHLPPEGLFNDPSHKFFGIYSQSILLEDSQFFEDFTDNQIRQAIDKSWSTFISIYLPNVCSVIQRFVLDA